MFSLIVAFPKLEDAKNLKNVLTRYGYSDIFATNSGAQVIGIANELDGGIVISGYRLSDMHYHELYGFPRAPNNRKTPKYTRENKPEQLFL